jgi:thiosulfate dehydrogenase [quinone] large subunit
VDVRGRQLSEPGFVRALFNDTRFSIVWLVVRLFVGYQWLNSGLGKLGNPAWTDGGTALAGFWKNAAAIPATGKPPITYDWYRGFIQALLDGGHHVWFAKLVVFGEIAVGAALIVGAFVAVAAFFGAFMNLNFMLAGTASTNPVLFTLAILLIAAWKIAGYIGLDYVLLRRATFLARSAMPAPARAERTVPRIAGGEDDA